jgi:hypothetical protein
MADARATPEQVDPPDPAQAAVAAFAAGHDDLVLAGAEAVELVTGLLDEAGINYLSVSGRTKSVASFAEKAVRTADGVRLYADPLREIGDQLGCGRHHLRPGRRRGGRRSVGRQVVVTDDRDLGRGDRQRGRFGYASRHVQITLDSAREGQPGYAHLRGRQRPGADPHGAAARLGGVRARHPLQGHGPVEHARDFDRRFTLAAGLLELRRPGVLDDPRPARGRRHDRTRGDADDDPASTPRELRGVPGGQYADAGWSRTDHYAWVSGLLWSWASLARRAGECCGPPTRRPSSSGWIYRYPPGAVRRLATPSSRRTRALHRLCTGTRTGWVRLRTRLDKLVTA